MKSEDSKGTRPSAFPEGELPYGGGQEGTVALHALGEVAGGSVQRGAEASTLLSASATRAFPCPGSDL